MQGTAQLILLVIGFSVFGLVFAAYLARWVLKHSTGSEAMQRISNAIKEGAEAFLRRQNRTILMLAVLFAAMLFVGYGFIRSHREFDPVGSSLALATWITLSFVFGALCSVFAGYVGMWVSIRANIRTAHAALTSLNDALRIALRGGAVSGLLVVAMTPPGRGRPLRPGQRARRRGADQDPAADRRLRLRRLVRGAVRPARRRYLHQGRRRRRGPGRQGRGRHPRGRPAQPGGDRRPGRRQRRRLRRPWRRPVRVHRGGEHRRHDPRRLAGRGGREGRHGVFRWRRSA